MRLPPLAVCALAVASCGPLPPEQSGPRYASAPYAPVQAEVGDADYLMANRPGEMVDITTLAVPGKVTVVELEAAWCRACKYLKGRLVGLARTQPVAIRSVDVADMDTPVARRYGVWALPQVHIFDADGRLYTVLRGRSAQSAPRIASDLARNSRWALGPSAR